MILAASFDKKLFQLYSNRNNICQWLYKTGTHWLKHLGFMNLKQLSWQEHTLYQWILQTNYLSPVDHCKRSSLYFLFNFFFFWRSDLISLWAGISHMWYTSISLQNLVRFIKIKPDLVFILKKNINIYLFIVLSQVSNIIRSHSLGYTNLREVTDDKLQGVRALMALPISMHHHFPPIC